MGREQRRREQFKNKNKNIKEELDISIKLSTVIKLVGFIVILLFVIYYILAVFVTKELTISGNNNQESTVNETTDTSNISDKILASNIFNQSEDEYYVYFYDFTDEDPVASSSVSSITDIKVYKVDTSSSLNANYVTDEKGNKDADDIDELKVKNPTVIKIKADKIVEYYEGSNDIYKALQD